MTAENTIAEKRNQADAEKKKLDDIQLKPAGLEAKIAQLQQRKADLEAALAQVNQEIQTARTELEAMPSAIEQQRVATASAIKATMAAAKALKKVPGSIDNDLATIDSVDSIMRRTIELIQKYLN